MTRPAIEVRSLRKQFRRQAGWRTVLRPTEPTLALAGIDLTVHQGEIYGLLGPNGAGKTTLLKVLCGLVRPDGGSAAIDGCDVAHQGQEIRRRVGLVYGDERSFYWRLSLAENLRFYARLYSLNARMAEHRIAELLRLVDLTTVSEVRMLAFSSGMKQRAAIARGLIHDPSVILMDEPTRSLDPVGAEDLHHLIRERVAGGGRTVLIATNSMNEGEALCDRLALIDHGATVLAGTIADFRNHMRAEVGYRLVVSGGEAGWSRGLMAIPGVSSVSAQPLGEAAYDIALELDRGGSGLATVIRYLVEQSVDVRSCTKLEPTLEEIFVQVVRRRRPREAQVS